MDQTQVKALFDALLSASNEERQRGEEAFRAWRARDAGACVQTLLAVVCAPETFAEAQRQMACVQLRIALVSPRDSVWPQLAPAVQQAVKHQLLALLVRDDASAPVRRAVDAAVAALGTYLLAELPPSVVGSRNNGQLFVFSPFSLTPFVFHLFHFFHNS